MAAAADAPGTTWRPTVGPDILRAGTTKANPIEESDAREAMARDQARRISSFTDFPAQGRQIGARWHGPGPA